jgi:hypothetical protein
MIRNSGAAAAGDHRDVQLVVEILAPQKCRRTRDRGGRATAWEFLFLPLQESSYDASSVGGQTNCGIVKGIWQLIPSAALDNRFRPGPLKDLLQFDSSNQRYKDLASTQTAIRNLAYLYPIKR